MKKVWMYVDGPNFYYSIKDTGTNIALGWCDFRKLAEQHFLEEDSILERISYFTAPVGDLGWKDGEDQRQEKWITAVSTIKNLQTFRGYYMGDVPKNRREKQTDVNIAIQLLLGALKEDGYDTAILVSGDTDLIPAVLAVQRETLHKKSVQIYVPLREPSHYWTDLAVTEGIVVKKITSDMLLDSRLPETISSRRGNVNCPENWKLK